MTDPRTKVLSFLLVVTVIAGAVPAAGVGPVAAATTGNDDPGNTPSDDPANTPGDDPDAFHLQQNGQCYEIGTLGDGSQSVEAFYDYRNPETDPSSDKYASFGTTHLQDNQESKLLVYNGSDGYSLVVIHDEMSQDDGGAPYGSTVTFQLSGVNNSSWVVQDDSYDDGNQDDNWDTAGNTHEIDWKWSGDRNDGGALSNVTGEEITIDPGFNEDASAWDSWPYAGDEQNKTDDWRVVDREGDYRFEQFLDMSESVTLVSGTCSDGASPSADLTSSPKSAGNDGTVTLDASSSTDADDDIEEYHWDVDGDGEIDERTDDASLEHTYEQSGNYTATVLVVDETNREDTATTTVEVPESDDGDGGDDGSGGDDGDSSGGDDSDGGDDPPADGSPNAALSLTDSVADFSNTVGFNASGSTADGEIVEYHWDFDGDGHVDRTTPDESTEGSKTNDAHTAYHVVYSLYDDPGTYTAEVTVVTDDGDTDTATAELEVEKNDETEPSATLDVPPEVTVGEQFEVEATDISEVTIQHVGWVFDGEVGPTGETVKHTFEETGEKKVELRLIDHAGNKNVLNTTVDVVEADDGDSGDGDSDDGDTGDGDEPDDGDTGDGDTGDGDESDDGDDSDGDDSNEGGLDDDDDRDSHSGGVPSVDPGDDESADDRAMNDGPRSVAANLSDDDGRFGSVVATADNGSKLAVEVHGTAPGGLPAPSPDADGFEAITFLTVEGADGVNLTVANDRLDAVGATPENVSLFRYENDTWSAVETSVTNASGNATEFRANATNGTYALGVERPAIGVADLTVQNAEIAAGDSATIAVTVENDGLAAGEGTVELTVDGDVVETRTVSLPAGEWQTLRFAPTFADEGTFEVTVGDASAEIVVESAETTTTTTTTETSDAGEPTTTTEATVDPTTTDDSSAGTPGFGVAVALVALLAATLLALRRR
ncbi:PKD domain-containing protein [Halorussus litoreus]|uniref:PKD domain-containing protein n=1 Tax=Halorussus litoreus TaxID=1710536 RepID=UPI000E22231D|nr:PKD domain-containing protein [Halorussus litoreus]